MGYLRPPWIYYTYNIHFQSKFNVQPCNVFQDILPEYISLALGAAVSSGFDISVVSLASS